MTIRNKIYCANLGDSRAIVARGKNFDPFEYSHDHKPDCPKEKARILATGGRCEPYRNLLGN